MQKDTLEKLEKIVSEPTETGFRTVLSEFFNAWSDLSKTPRAPTVVKSCGSKRWHWLIPSTIPPSN